MKRALGQDGRWQHPRQTRPCATRTPRRSTAPAQAAVSPSARRRSAPIDSLKRSSGFGLQKGDVVALLLSIVPKSSRCSSRLARNRHHRTAAQLSLGRRRNRRPHALDGGDALIYEGRFAAEAQAAHRALPAITRIIRVASPETDLGRDYEQLLRAASPRPPEIENRRRRPLLLQPHSGTTGVPKAYMLTHYNNCATGFIFRSSTSRERDVLMTVFPISAGSASPGVASVLYGIPNVLANFDAGEVLRLIAAERITIVNLVPTMAAMLLQASAAAREPSALRAIVFAGAVLPPTIREQALKSLCATSTSTTA